jgi:CTP synthase (UTP-ammonia lyase)
VLGIQDAEHEETTPDASIRFISKLSCSLVGETQIIHITPDTLIFQAYGEEKVIEQFHCNYGLNEEYRDEMGNGELKIVGVDTNGAARIVELPNHRFFIATLFLPQLSSSPEEPHPLIIAYMKAALAFRGIKQTSEVKM